MRAPPGGRPTSDQCSEMSTRATRTTELLLRPWTLDDAVGLREAIDEDVDHVKPWLTWTLEEPASLEQTRRRLATYVEQFRTGRAHRYAITPAHRPAVILGGANLYLHGEGPSRGVGYWVRKSAERTGVAGAAVSALLVQVFGGSGVDRVVLHCDIANRASAAFAEHLAFERIGPADRPFTDGSPRPVLEFELTRARFQEHEGAFQGRAQRVRMAGPTELPPG